MVADHGYDTDAILKDIAARGAEAVIPAKRSRRVQRPLHRTAYAARNRIERFFSDIKHMRRVATRYDHTADGFLGFIILTTIRR